MSEPSTPDDPARGLAWSAIAGQIAGAGSESEFVSVTDTLRATFGKHPWSIGGGGAADLKEFIESDRHTVKAIADEVGLERAARRDWLLDRLENLRLWPASADHPPQLTTVNALADAVRADAGFMQIAELYAGHPDFDLTRGRAWRGRPRAGTGTPGPRRNQSCGSIPRT